MNQPTQQHFLTIMPLLASMVAGVFFGLGAIIGGMGNPAKVINFFDIAGHWDPSLALVMGGALSVTLIGYQWIFRGNKPLLADNFHRPPQTSKVDNKLIFGSIVFGVGWGIGGFCPGPSFAMLLSFHPDVLIFIAGLLGGMIIKTLAKL